MFRTGNYIEAVVWFVLAVVMVGVAWRSASDARWRAAIAAIVLIAFGLSDVVEVRTGAWWRPWWLLLWKSNCVVTLVVLLLKHRLQSRVRGQGWRKER